MVGADTRAVRPRIGGPRLLCGQLRRTIFACSPLRQTVTTSGRKLRAHSARELLMSLGRLALRGPSAIKQREGMELWYAERRQDPQKRPSADRMTA